jgi:hypothetical protein
VTRIGPLYQFVQSKDYLVMISDDDSPGFHQIYLDGRPHPKEPDPQWYGHSIGHWEGDTLVVDRVNFEEQVWLDQESHIRIRTNCTSSPSATAALTLGILRRK